MNTHLSTAEGGVAAAMQLIGGASVEARAGRRIEVVCPSDGLPFASIPRSGDEDVDAAVRAARQAFDTGPWSRMTAAERGRCLTRLGLLVERHADELAALESRDTGKPARQGRADVAATMRYYEFYGGAADKIMATRFRFSTDTRRSRCASRTASSPASSPGTIPCRFCRAWPEPRWPWATRWW